MNTIKISKLFTFIIPSTFEELNEKQLRKIRTLLLQNISPPLRILELSILKILFERSFWTSFIFPWLSFYQKIHCLILVKWLTEPSYNHKIIAKKGFFVRNREINFIEFIRIYDLFIALSQCKGYEGAAEDANNLVTHIIAVLYRPENQPKYDDDKHEENSKLLEDQNPLIKLHLLQQIRKEFDQLLEAFPLIFQKDAREDTEQLSRKSDHSTQWLKVARQAIGDITKFEEVLYLAANYVLFDLQNKIELHREMKKNKK